MERADLRRQQREDERLLGAGVSKDHPPATYVTALTRRLSARWQRAKAEQLVDGPVGYLFSFIDTSSRRLAPSTGLACRKGCDFCCKLWVSVTAPEAFYLARTIRTTTLAAAVAAGADDRRGTSHADRASIMAPCPLLDHGSCSAYAARPTNCRMAVSQAVEACKRAYVEMMGTAIPVPIMFTGLGFIAQTAFAASMKQHGLPTRAYELSAAVHRAIDEPGLERRWLEGVDVFAGLHADPVDPGESPNVRAAIEAAFRAD